jgi:sulfatase maturation enzyme AslB (radical SAM superfamily)
MTLSTVSKEYSHLSPEEITSCVAYTKSNSPLPGYSSDLIQFKKLAILDHKAAQKSYLGRLTINISNNCNLWCEYCYADHGFYHAPRSLMSLDVAKEIMHKITDIYEPIKTVQFFGGEPLMNPSVMIIIRYYSPKIIVSILSVPCFVETRITGNSCI